MVIIMGEEENQFNNHNNNNRITLDDETVVDIIQQHHQQQQQQTLENSLQFINRMVNDAFDDYHHQQQQQQQQQHPHQNQNQQQQRQQQQQQYKPQSSPKAATSLLVLAENPIAPQPATTTSLPPLTTSENSSLPIINDGGIGGSCGAGGGGGEFVPSSSLISASSPQPSALKSSFNVGHVSVTAAVDVEDEEDKVEDVDENNFDEERQPSKSSSSSTTTSASLHRPQTPPTPTITSAIVFMDLFDNNYHHHHQYQQHQQLQHHNHHNNSIQEHITQLDNLFLSISSSPTPSGSGCGSSSSNRIVNDAVDDDDDEEEEDGKQPNGRNNNNNNRNSKKQQNNRKKQERRRERQLFRRGNHPNRNRYRPRTYWNAMPIDILEKIFQLLPIKDRHTASQVCPHWFECFYSPSIWTSLVINDNSFTKRKFNYYLGYQRMIDPFKTQIYLQKFGHSIRRLTIQPMGNFFNLYEFMKILSQFAQHYDPNPLRYLNRFDFSFGCRSYISSINDDGGFDHNNRRVSFGDIRDTETGVIGTGGKLLEALKELMFYLIGLKHLALRDLLLNADEARTLLDNVAINCYEQLKSLTLINCCKNQCAFLHTGIFINLETLVISCQHLDEDVLMLLAYNKLNNLYIVQTEVTRSQGPLSSILWKKFCKINSHTKIHLVMELALQPTRITSIIYDAPMIRPSCVRLIEVSQLYHESLECIAFYNLPKFSIRKSYRNRIDTILIYLSQQCCKLRTLIINDLISTSTLLLIVTNARNLTKLIVRRNAIKKRFDCSINPEWRDNYVEWLKRTSSSYEMTFQEISRMLGYQWQPLSDDQFKRIKPDVKF